MRNLVWLIDMGYVTKASKGRGKIDYIETKKFLEKRYGMTCLPIIFNSVDNYGVDFGLNQFYYTVKKAGFMVNLYQMEGGAQKQVDVAIGAHLVYYAMKQYDIVLSSGDVDFVPAIDVSRKDNDQLSIVLLTFNFGVSPILSELASEHILIDEHPEILRS
ncbi:NYN domain-containing protein [Chryseosolibacter indicus]|nr:NYN domain-containing protein [Chryseosolibacter indicus]